MRGFARHAPQGVGIQADGRVRVEAGHVQLALV